MTSDELYAAWMAAARPPTEVEVVHGRWIFAASPELLHAACPSLVFHTGDEELQAGRPVWAAVTESGCCAGQRDWRVWAPMAPRWWTELAQRAEEDR